MRLMKTAPGRIPYAIAVSVELGKNMSKKPGKIKGNIRLGSLLVKNVYILPLNKGWPKTLA